MKQKNRYIAIAAVLLLAVMLFPGMPAYAGSQDNDEGYKDGYNAGWTDGMEAAWEDLDEGNRKSYSKAIPSNSDIKEYYELDEESRDYREGFLDGYRDGFREGYNFGYENPESGAKASVNYDEELGYSMGEIRGRLDYYGGLKNAWNLSVPKPVEIIQIFGLKMESEAYKNDFITNFRVYYKKGYEYGYRTAKFAPMQTAIEQGAKDGEQFGGILGASKGRLDYYSGSTSLWDRELPPDSGIEG
ncbi:MAG: Yae1 family protein, partial [Clostridiaceae bacterium]|nr:Yae1 family protein [Clostridiaceae bacterium]